MKAKRLPRVSGEAHEAAWRQIERLEEENRRLRAALLFRDQFITHTARKKRLNGSKGKSKVRTKRDNPVLQRHVKRLREDGWKLEAIAREVGINPRTVSAILKGKQPKTPDRMGRRPHVDPLKNCTLYLDTE